MRRQAAIGLASAVLLTLVLASVALGKGEQIAIALNPPPPDDPHAGAPITLGVDVTFRDGAPVTGESVRFTLTRIGGSGVVTAAAHEDRPGHYVATVTAPTQGGWTVNVTATAEGMSQTYQAAVLRLLPPAAPAVPAAATPAAPAWGLVVALMLLVAVAGAGALIAARRRTATQASRT
jgi:hypothetical protein